MTLFPLNFIPFASCRFIDGFEMIPPKKYMTMLTWTIWQMYLWYHYLWWFSWWMITPALFYMLCPHYPGELLELAHRFSEMSRPESEDPPRDPQRVCLPGMLDEWTGRIAQPPSQRSKEWHDVGITLINHPPGITMDSWYVYHSQENGWLSHHWYTPIKSNPRIWMSRG